jgi:hypothetical protein
MGMTLPGGEGRPHGLHEEHAISSRDAYRCELKPQGGSGIRMDVFELDQRELTSFGSQGTRMSSLDGGSGDYRVSVAYLVSGGLIGMHAAPAAQMLAPVVGEVVVRSGKQEATLLPGAAVRFEVGEQHETSARVDSTIIIVESRS